MAARWRVTYPAWWKDLRVALSHDWLTGMRGGERVLELLCGGFPDATIFTLVHKRGGVSATIESHPIQTSWLQRIPGAMDTYRYFLPLYPLFVRTWPTPSADVVISTSHCIAKAIRVPSTARHLCYCFTPMRYVWVFYEEYFGRNPIKAAVLRPMLAAIRMWDRATSKRVHKFLTLSRHVQERIRVCYRREADVVYPPVDLDYFSPGSTGPAEFDLVVSALVPYKRIDIAVAAYNRLGYPLLIAGTGTEMKRLQSMARQNIRFLGWQTDEEIRELYRRCRFLIFPAQEDFGLVPVEAMACGRPVIAYGRGGVTESVVEGVTGTFFYEQTPEALCEAVEVASRREWNPLIIRRHAERFSPQVFVDSFDMHLKTLIEARVDHSV